MIGSQSKYFLLKNKYSDKALTASITNIGEVVTWSINYNDTQLWFWDIHHSNVLRNKAFPEKVSFLYNVV